MGSYLFQIPFSPRKGGIPLSTEMPAPVKAVTCRASLMIDAASRIFLFRSSFMAYVSKVIQIKEQTTCQKRDANKQGDH